VSCHAIDAEALTARVALTCRYDDTVGQKRLEWMDLGEVSPLADTTFADLDPVDRATILQRLCDATLEARAEVRDEILENTEVDDLRVEPVGVDETGNRYYYFPMFYRDCRLYRAPKNDAYLGGRWDLIFDTMSDFKRFMPALASGKSKIEGELKDAMEDIMETMEEQEEERLRQLARVEKERAAEAQRIKQVCSTRNSSSALCCPVSRVNTLPGGQINDGAVRQSSRVQSNAQEQAEKAKQDETERQERVRESLAAQREKVRPELDTLHASFRACIAHHLIEAAFCRC
jgi:hypothetical protein